MQAHEGPLLPFGSCGRPDGIASAGDLLDLGDGPPQSAAPC